MHYSEMCNPRLVAATKLELKINAPTRLRQYNVRFWVRGLAGSSRTRAHYGYSLSLSQSLSVFNNNVYATL